MGFFWLHWFSGLDIVLVKALLYMVLSLLLDRFNK